MKIGGRKINKKAKVRAKNETECLKFGKNISRNFQKNHQSENAK